MDAKLHGRQRNRKLENRPPRRHVIGVAGCLNEAAPGKIALMRRPQVTAPMVAASGGSTHTCRPAIAHKCDVAFDLFDGPEVFKRTSCIAGLKPTGRFVAKELFDASTVSPLMKTLVDNGLMHGDCVAVTGCTMAENLKWMAWNPDQDVVRPAQDAGFEKRRGGVAAAGNGSGHVW